MAISDGYKGKTIIVLYFSLYKKHSTIILNHSTNIICR